MKSWTIRKLLSAGFAAPIAVVIALSVAFIYSIGAIDGHVRSIVSVNVPGLVLSNQAAVAALTYRGDTLRHVMSTDAAEMKALDADCEKMEQEILQALKSYEATIQGAEGRDLFSHVAPAWEAYSALAREARRLSSEGKTPAALEIVKTKGGQAMVTFQESIRALVAFNVRASDASDHSVTKTIKRTRGLVSVLAVGALVISLGAAFYITRTVNGTIQRVSNVLDETSAQVTSAASEVSGASQSLAEGASEQAASLEETSASIEELSSMTKRNAESAQQTKELSNQTRQAADNCAGNINAMNTAMGDIKKSSSDIAKIIKTIDEIAFQTNILALNAAVEAARAGDAGMGFAVVAEEVRSLAQRSAQSARETAEKIEVAIAKSENGVQISEQVAASLAEIVEKARKVDALVAEIASASQEQNQGISQVSLTVNQMDQVTQSTAGNAEETAAAAEELSAQAQSMRDAVTSLRRLINPTRLSTQRVEPVSRGRSNSTLSDSAPSVAAPPLRRPQLRKA